MEETIIISLGGSLIVPDEIDVEFLRDFKTLILEHVKQGKKFIIITGGGKINNRYNAAAKEISEPSDVDLDWIGIAALKLNAELLRVIFSDWANKKVIENLSKPFSFEKSIVIGAAYEPGKSSDWDAVECAKTIGAKKIINLSNTDYVYDSDPKLNPAARKIERISWPEYRKIIPKEWTSRLNSPFDPVASQAAEEAGLEVDILNGKNIANLRKCLSGDDFRGTKIK
jgi:uridylate kinase